MSSLLQTLVAMVLPSTCSMLIYRKQATREWVEFWHERKSGPVNIRSSCPWTYVRVNNATNTDCGNMYAKLHHLAGDNCISVDLSSSSRRIYSHGKCIALRSACACDKVIGYTCSYPIDIPAGPADKRSEDKCNVTKIIDGDDATKVIKVCENKTNTNTESSTVILPTAQPYVSEKQNTKKPHYVFTKKPESDAMVPPFLKGGIPPFLHRNNFQRGPPLFLQGLNPQQGVPPLLRPSQFNMMGSHGVNLNVRNTEMNENGANSERNNASSERIGANSEQNGVNSDREDN